MNYRHWSVGRIPVSYTHLDVYKRQLQIVTPKKLRVSHSSSNVVVLYLALSVADFDHISNLLFPEEGDLRYDRAYNRASVCTDTMQIEVHGSKRYN